MEISKIISLKDKLIFLLSTTKEKVKLFLLKFFLFLSFLILISNQKITLNISLDSENPINPKEQIANNYPKSNFWWNKLRKNNDVFFNVGNIATISSSQLTKKELEIAKKYSNLGLIINPGYAQKRNIDSRIVNYKKEKCLNYVKRFLKTAKEESNLFGIPVSITLAQGLLESNAGDSKLSSIDHNHFGIKCKKKCVGCRCANYTDDSKYDMFRVFDSAWESYREHSKLLMGKRYRHLHKLDSKDYKNWAHGLSAAGYATDKKYANKLISIINSLKLYEFDV